jgi:hypothetical protein
MARLTPKNWALQPNQPTWVPQGERKVPFGEDASYLTIQPEITASPAGRNIRVRIELSYPDSYPAWGKNELDVVRTLVQRTMNRGRNPKLTDFQMAAGKDSWLISKGPLEAALELAGKVASRLDRWEWFRDPAHFLRDLIKTADTMIRADSRYIESRAFFTGSLRRFEP